MNLRHIVLTTSDVLGFFGRPVIEIGLGGRIQASVLDVLQKIDATIAGVALRQPVVLLDMVASIFCSTSRTLA